MNDHAAKTHGAGKHALHALLLSFTLTIFMGCDIRFDSASQGDIEFNTGGGRVVFELKDTVDADAPSAAHDRAGRSAFPEIGETIDKPIAYKRLSDAEQFVRAIDPADIPAVVPWDEASQYVGYEITVQGRVVDVGQSRDGEVNFLNFHRDWRGKFYMVLFEDLARTLDKPVVDLFTGKLVRVKGKVQTYRGKPQIRITSMDQVAFVQE